MIKKNLFLITDLIFLLFAWSCQAIPTTPTPNDETTYYIWVGDDSLDTGPIDMQTLLFLEMDGYDSPVQMKREISPRNVLSYPPASMDFLEDYGGKKNVNVVLQMFGLDSTFSDTEFKKNADQWIKVLQQKNAQPILLYPWVSQVASQDTIDRLDVIVHQFAWQHKLLMVPVGPAWSLVGKDHPEILLYASDGIHPSPEGVYLTACVLFASISGRSPLEISARTSVGYDQPNEIITIDDSVVLILQESAWKVLQDYEQKGEFQVFMSK